MSEWVAVCKVDDIPLLGARRLARAQGTDVALFRTAGGQVHALLDRCPHKAGPLSQGIVMEHGVACPLHNWTIAFADGCAQAPDNGCTARFEVRLSDEGDVELDRAQLSTLGLDTAPDQSHAAEAVKR